mmetsp:Transcript_137896/g.294694  ORF Transcript_137896/g.294694 Transcript_137896/m.294694 type:complete len:210 (+) Transcript_137896:137-766(+)
MASSRSERRFGSSRVTSISSIGGTFTSPGSREKSPTSELLTERWRGLLPVKDVDVDPSLRLPSLASCSSVSSTSAVAGRKPMGAWPAPLPLSCFASTPFPPREAGRMKAGKGSFATSFDEKAFGNWVAEGAWEERVLTTLSCCTGHTRLLPSNTRGSSAVPHDVPSGQYSGRSCMCAGATEMHALLWWKFHFRPWRFSSAFRATTLLTK